MAEQVMNVLVTAGSFESDECALIAADLTREHAELVLRYRPPPHLRVAGKGWTGGDWLPGPAHGAGGARELLVCGFAAVYRIDARAWRITGILHQPCMNDLHHVTATSDRIYVANTGMDAVDVFDHAGSFLGSHACQPAWLAAHRWAGSTPARNAWAHLLAGDWSGALRRFQPEAPRGGYYDQRSAAAHPFHQRVVRDFVHPNHIRVIGDRILCTRLADRSVMDMRRFEPVLRDDTPGHPHDGVAQGGRFWLTCVNGLVVGYDMTASPWIEAERIDVFARSERAGWCRGLCVTPEHVIIGLTRLHGTSRYPWNDRHPELSSADTESAIVCVSRSDGRVIARVPLEGVDGWHANTKIYSILELP
jgi:hypothetical protein